MVNYRRQGVIVGILFIVATVSGIASGAFAPELFGPENLGNVWGMADSEIRVIVGLLLELTMAIAVAAIPIWAYPVLRRQNESAALAYVVGRLAEGLLYAAGVLAALALLAVSKEAALPGMADRAQLRLVATALLAVRQGESALGSLAFSLGSLFFYALCYRFRLIPRWLSIWALIGAVLFLASSVMPLFGVSVRSTLYMLLNVPGGLQEMVLAVWLIVKGFNQPALAE